MELFDTEHLATCERCGEEVQTLAGWPGPIAACVQCDVWTLHDGVKQYGVEPGVIVPDTTLSAV